MNRFVGPSVHLYVCPTLWMSQDLLTIWTCNFQGINLCIFKDGPRKKIKLSVVFTTKFVIKVTIFDHVHGHYSWSNMWVKTTLRFISDYTLQIHLRKIYLHTKFQSNILKIKWITVFYDKDIFSRDHKIFEYWFLNIFASRHTMHSKFSGHKKRLCLIRWNRIRTVWNALNYIEFYNTRLD